MLKAITLQTAELLDTLPDDDISIVNALVKRLVRAWDTDFTKVTPGERNTLDKADEEMKKGHYISEDEFWK